MKRLNVRTLPRLLGVAGWLLFAAHAPATTLHVNNSSKTNGDGSPGAPFTSIKPALDRAAPGDVIEIAAGMYREALTVAHGGQAGKPVTIRAAVPGTVVVSGAVVLKHWKDEAAGTYSVSWKHDFIIDFKDGQPVRNHGADAPVGCAEQVVWRGWNLRQVMTRAEIADVTFFVDWDADRLYIRLPNGADPNSAPIEAAALESVLAPANEGVTDVVVEGITFERAGSFAQRGAVTTGTRWTLKNCLVRRNSGLGLMIHGDDVTLDHVVNELNGQMGFSADEANRSAVTDCESRFNNTKGFNADWEAGGCKFVRTDGFTLTRFTSHDNVGPGVWFDIDNRNYAITDCVVYGNTGGDPRQEGNPTKGSGIFLEIGPGPGVVKGCVVFNNSGSGIRVAESRAVAVEGNVCVGNGTALELRAMPAREFELHDVTITGNRFARSRDAEVQTTLGAWVPASVTGRAIRLDGNTYDPSAGVPVARWGDTVVTRASDLGRLLGVDRTAFQRQIELASPHAVLAADYALQRPPAPRFADQLSGTPDRLTLRSRGDVILTDTGWSAICADDDGTLILLSGSPPQLHTILAVSPTPVSKSNELTGRFVVASADPGIRVVNWTTFKR